MDIFGYLWISWDILGYPIGQTPGYLDGLEGDKLVVIAVEEADSLPYLLWREPASRVQFASEVCQSSVPLSHIHFPQNSLSRALV